MSRITRKEQELADKLMEVLNSKFADVRLNGSNVIVRDRKGNEVKIQSPQRINNVSVVIFR